MRVSRRRYWLFWIVVSGGAVSMVLQRAKPENSRADQAPFALHPAGESPEERVNGYHSNRREAELPGSRDLTVRDTLMEHWGSNWKEVEAKYEAAGIDLTTALQDSPLSPWSEVALAASDKARSYYERGKDFRASIFTMKLEADPDNFKKQFGIDPDLDIGPLLLELEIECADLDYELEVLYARYDEQMEMALNSLIEAGPERSPLLLIEKEREPGTFNTIHVEEGGWYAVYRFKRDKFPILASIMSEKAPLVAQRLRRMREFASRLP